MIVVNSIYGQRSNRLMEIANAMAVAIDRGETLVLTEFSEFCHDYRCAVSWEGRVVVKRSKFWSVVRVCLKHVRRIVPSFQIRIPDVLTVIDDWSFWDWPCVARHLSEIKSFFEPVVSEDVKSSFRPGRVAGGRDLLLGVHVRRGDYREFANGRFFFDDATYIRAIGECAGVLGCSRVLVFSNEALDEANFKSGCPNCEIAFPHGSAVEDQWMMSQCDYLIGPPSTFTWRACFLGDGVKLGPVGDGPIRRDRFRDIGKEIARS